MFLDNEYYTEYKRIIENRRKHSIDGYSENHHIIPKSLGGNDDEFNMVRLSAIEHFQCHILLPLFTEGNDRDKMAFAWDRMANYGDKPIDYEEYEVLKIQLSKSKSRMMKEKWASEDNPWKDRDYNSENNPNYRDETTPDSPLKGVAKTLSHRKKMSDSHKGVPKTEEHKQALSKSHTGKKLSEEHKQAISDGSPRLSGDEHHQFGKPLTEKHKQKISDSMKGISHTEMTTEIKNQISETLKNKPEIKCPYCGKITISAGNYKRWHGDNCKLKNLT